MWCVFWQLVYKLCVYKHNRRCCKAFFEPAFVSGVCFCFCVRNASQKHVFCIPHAKPFLKKALCVMFINLLQRTFQTCFCISASFKILTETYKQTKSLFQGKQTNLFQGKRTLTFLNKFLFSKIMKKNI